MQKLNVLQVERKRSYASPDIKTLKVFEEELVSLQCDMLNYAFSLTSNREAAKDLRQEANIKILSNFDRFRYNGNFKGWTLKIMYNIFVNGYRQTARRKAVLDQTENLYLLNFPRYLGPQTPADVYSCLEITNIINSFEDNDKIPIWMYISGYKYREIAETMKTPIGTIKSRMFLARKKIQKRLSA